MDIPYLDLRRVTALYQPAIDAALAAVVASGRYLRGAHVAQFEEQFAAYTGSEYCVSCGSGLDALAIMLRAYKELGVLKDGDEVVVPANTYIATILAITENNLVPILVEPRRSTFQIDDSRIEEVLTNKTRALLLVHLYGYYALTERIVALCKKHHLLLLEDCAQAHGLHNVCPPLATTTLRGARAYSFYPTKNLGALADAGAITTSDKALAEVARAITNYGSAEKYVFRYKGRNSRMDEATAAVLSVKLPYLDRDNRRRRDIAQRYVEEIAAPVTLPPLEGVHHIFPILCAERNRLQHFLKDRGIETVVHYPIPPHRQECYKEYSALSLPITECLAHEELSLPLHQALTDDEVSAVVAAVNAFV